MNENILVLGDIHGDWVYISHHLKEYNIENYNIIQVGDFGIGFKHLNKELRMLDELNQSLNKRNCTLYVIRGNHDNPFYFTDKGIDMVNKSNIKFIKDYTTLNIGGHNIFCVGGAISVDRQARTKNISYWEDEKFVLDKEKCLNAKNIDIIITHTSPDLSFPFDFNHIVHYYAENDPKLLDDLQYERELVRNMFNLLKVNNTIKKYFYGHFHTSYNMEYDFTEFTLLDINEFKEIR